MTMKELINKFNLFIGKEIKVATEYDEWSRSYTGYTTRVGEIVDITNNLIVVRFTVIGRRNIRYEIECFNKGDIISRGVSSECINKGKLKFKEYELVL